MVYKEYSQNTESDCRKARIKFEPKFWWQFFLHWDKNWPELGLKHCQRHNGPRVLILSLESAFCLNWMCIHFSCSDNSRFKLNTLGPLCLWQCLFSNFDFHISHFDFHISHFDFHISHFDIHISHFDFNISQFDFNISHFDFHISHLEFQISLLFLHVSHLYFRFSHLFF